MSYENQDGLPPEVLKKLQVEYRKTIPEKIQQIHCAIERIKEKPSPENLSALRFLVHKLAGNAETFGFPKVTQVCRRWDMRLKEAIQSSHLDPAFWTDIEALRRWIEGAFDD